MEDARGHKLGEAMRMDHSGIFQCGRTSGDVRVVGSGGSTKEQGRFQGSLPRDFPAAGVPGIG